jgi:hypothetical protein
MKRSIVWFCTLVAIGAAVVMITLPQHEPPLCPTGWACLQHSTADGDSVLRVNSETWVTVHDTAKPGLILINNQEPGDDACVAEGPHGAGRIVCVQSREARTVPDLIALSARG